MKLHQLSSRHERVERRFLKGDADRTANTCRVRDDVVAGHARVAARRLEQRRQHPDCRRLARAVWAEERVSFIQEEVADLRNVQVKAFSNLVVEFARESGANAIVKGLRAISDFEYEFEMNQLNRKLAADIESVYLMASPEYSFLSSSGIKELATFGAEIEDLVPPYVAEALHDRLSRGSK